MNHLKIITTVYNGEQYIEKYIRSLQAQHHRDWTAYVIDDASTDGTYSLLLQLIKGDSRFIAVCNDSNQKAIANYVKYIPYLSIDPEDIIISIDGDDCLYGESVFTRVKNIYAQDPRIMLTYGQYVTSSDLESGKLNAGGCRPLDNLSDICKPGVNLSHLKTFKRKAWDLLEDEDLRRWDGKYIQRAWDQPCMLNVCRKLKDGLQAIHYFHDIQYVYNVTNPISEWKIDEGEQMAEDAFVRARVKRLMGW